MYTHFERIENTKKVKRATFLNENLKMAKLNGRRTYVVLEVADLSEQRRFSI